MDTRDKDAAAGADDESARVAPEVCWVPVHGVDPLTGSTYCNGFSVPDDYWYTDPLTGAHLRTNTPPPPYSELRKMALSVVAPRNPVSKGAAKRKAKGAAGGRGDRPHHVLRNRRQVARKRHHLLRRRNVHGSPGFGAVRCARPPRSSRAPAPPRLVHGCSARAHDRNTLILESTRLHVV